MMAAECNHDMNQLPLSMVFALRCAENGHAPGYRDSVALLVAADKESEIWTKGSSFVGSWKAIPLKLKLYTKMQT